jgi:uncharacterized protein YqgV (UPF0045/DUF77 family)
MNKKVSKKISDLLEEKHLAETEFSIDYLEDLVESVLDITEVRSNSDIERVITRLRAEYRKNRLMTFREFLVLFAAIIG